MIEYPYNVLLGLVLFWSLLYVIGGRIKRDGENLELIIKPFFLQVKIRDINRFIDKLVRPKLVRALSYPYPLSDFSHITCTTSS